jgi:hypothetical protein
MSRATLLVLPTTTLDRKFLSGPGRVVGEIAQDQEDKTIIQGYIR